MKFYILLNLTLIMDPQTDPTFETTEDKIFYLYMSICFNLYRQRIL